MYLLPKTVNRQCCETVQFSADSEDLIPIPRESLKNWIFLLFYTIGLLKRMLKKKAC